MTQTAHKPFRAHTLAFAWRPHTSDWDNGPVRVWRNDWFGDQFEIVNRAELEEITKFCQRWGIPIAQADEDE